MRRSGNQVRVAIQRERHLVSLRSPDFTRRQSITTACAVNAQPQPGIRICRASSRRSVLMPCRRRDRRWSPPARQGLGKSREGVACQIGRHLDLQRPRPPRETDSPLERRGFELPVPPARMSLDFSRKEGAAGRIRLSTKALSSCDPPSCLVEFLRRGERIGSTIEPFTVASASAKRQRMECVIYEA